jgi:uncharacterized protein
MPAAADDLDLNRLRLTSGEGRRFDLEVAAPSFSFAGEPYAVQPSRLPVRLDLARTTGSGHALRLRFSAALEGPCMRCLEPAAPAFEVDVREVDQPGGGEDLSSPYVTDGVLDLRGWVRDALGLALPAQILCRPDCAGLCPECGADLNVAGPEHHHDPPPDPRWAALRGLDLGDA